MGQHRNLGLCQLTMRRFLFMQGHATPFYLHLGHALAQAGHHVSRINVCGGDREFWGDWQAQDFSGKFQDLGDFITETIHAHECGDLVLYNDCRPCNAIAIAKARALGLRIHVFEEGYLRPNWLTLEQDGINGHTRLPDDPQWYLDTAATLPPFDMGQPVGAGLRNRIVYDFRWQWANYRHMARYPHYRTHRPYPIWAEYATWVPRLATLKLHGASVRRIVEQMISGGRRFFLFPLQLDTDSQIRIHSPFGRLSTAIQAVMTDFARHAPGDTHLVIKNHPLDNGWINYRRLVHRLADDLDLAGRVHFIDGGDLNALLDCALGTVTVNSTVGLTALDRGRPVIALGQAVFAMPGLTFQGSLAQFWHDPGTPDARLLDAYRRVVLHSVLINGNFYTEDGMALGIANAVHRLCSAPDLLAQAPRRRSLQVSAI